MKLLAFLSDCLLILPLALSAWQGIANAAVPSAAVRPVPEDVRARLSEQLTRTRTALYTAHYEEGLTYAREAYRSAILAGDSESACRAMGNIGTAQFALRQFDAALKTYQEAHALALRSGLTAMAGLLTAAIANVYSELGEVDSAGAWLEKSMVTFTAREFERNLIQVQIELASIRARQGRMAEALRLFSTAMDGAEKAGRLAQYAQAWARLGEEYLRRNELDAAEAALLEAYRVRKLNGLPMDASYFDLGRVRLAQGDLRSAGVLLNRAVELLPAPQNVLTTWDYYHMRARVRMAEGKWREALPDLRIAVRLARPWRWSTPGDDAARMGGDGMLQGVYSSFIEAGNRVYRETHDAALLSETLEAAEESRAASLQVLLTDPKDHTAGMPPAYWETLNRLQRAEVEGLRNPGAKAAEAVGTLRSELVRMEAGIGPDPLPEPRDLLRKARAAIGSDTALLAFHTTAAGSWLWAIDRDGMVLYDLPPAARIASANQAWVTALRNDAPDAAARGSEMYALLFGQLDARFRGRTRWVLALDTVLFAVPFAALVEPAGRGQAWLVERHSVEIVPGLATMLRAGRKAEPVTGRFAAVGDPVYNLADPRFTGSRPKTGLVWKVLAGNQGPSPLPLARLVSSAAEIDACARAWGGDAMLLKGAAASRAGLSELLRRQPGVIHFATHFLPSSQHPGYALMALSLTDEGLTEVVTPIEIARWRIPASLVVMSGCASGQAGALPGSGLLGLTRAWLAAGARQVLASHWATPDDAGLLFVNFYRQLRDTSGMETAHALSLAQREMIRSGGWRAKPRYWASFFVTGRT